MVDRDLLVPKFGDVDPAFAFGDRALEALSPADSANFRRLA